MKWLIQNAKSAGRRSMMAIGLLFFSKLQRAPMFLESCGKICFSRFHPSFFYALLLIPFILSSSYLLSRYGFQQELESRFTEAAKKGKIAIQRKTRMEKF